MQHILTPPLASALLTLEFFLLHLSMDKSHTSLPDLLCSLVPFGYPLISLSLAKLVENIVYSHHLHYRPPIWASALVKLIPVHPAHLHWDCHCPEPMVHMLLPPRTLLVFTFTILSIVDSVCTHLLKIPSSPSLHDPIFSWFFLLFPFFNNWCSSFQLS